MFARTRVLLTMLVPCALILGNAAPAAAQGCQGPPGNSAVSQYCESIPDADTDRASSGESVVRGLDDNSAPGSPAPSIPAATERALNQAGQAGQAILNTALDDGPSGEKPKPKGASTGSAREVEPNDASNSPLEAVSASIQAGPTVGSGLLWMALIGTAGVLSAAWLRHRSGDSEE